MSFLKALLFSICMGVLSVASALDIDVSLPEGPVSGMWWVSHQENDFSPARPENGWGIAMQQQYNVVFSQIYTYDENKLPTWFVSVCTIQGNLCKGTLNRTFNGVPLYAYWPNGAVIETEVGTVSYEFMSDRYLELKMSMPVGNTGVMAPVLRHLDKMIFKPAP